MLTYIDSHAHYDAEQFDPDRAELLQTLHKGGVRNIVNIGCTLERSQFSIDLAEKFQFIGECESKTHAPFLHYHNHYALACKHQTNTDDSVISVDETCKM